MSRYSIEDAEAISRALAGGFEIPSAAARAELYPGDLATLFFNIEGHLPGEPLRVQVLDVEAPGQYIGRMVEESGDLTIGTPVAFDERHVAWIEPSQHAQMSGLFDVFDVFKKKPEPPSQGPPPPPLPKEEEAYPEASHPQDPYLRPPVLYLPYRPPMGLVPEAEMPLSEFRAPGSTPSPVKESLFSVFRSQPALPVSAEEKAGVFSVFIPDPPSMPVALPSEKDLGIFDIFNPEAMAREAEAMRQMGPLEVMVPKSEHGSMYQPEEKDPFEIFASEPSEKEEWPPGREEEPAEFEEAALPLGWKPPTVEWMIKRLKRIFNLDKVWEAVRTDYEDQPDPDDPVPSHIRTIINYEANDKWSTIGNFFDILDLDRTVIDPLLDKADKDPEAGAELDEIQNAVEYVMSQAFDALKPEDLPGTFGIYSHPAWGSMDYIGYLEEPDESVPPEERRRLRAGRDEIRKAEREKRERYLRSMVGDWRPMTWEEAAEFLDVNFGIQNLVRDIRKEKKTRRWKKEMRDYRNAIFMVEDFGDDNGDQEPRVAEFLGVPMSLVEYFTKEDELPALWEAVFYPGFESLEKAWENIRPDDLPGKLVATTDARDAFGLYYREDEGYNKREESEEGEEGEQEEE